MFWSVFEKCQTISNESRSRSERINFTWFSFQIVSKCSLTCFKKPRSVFVWSQRIIVVPRWMASRTAWWDNSPVNWTSTFFASAKTLEPEPAQTAIVLIEESSVLPLARARRTCFKPVRVLTLSTTVRIVCGALSSIKRP